MKCPCSLPCPALKTLNGMMLITHFGGKSPIEETNALVISLLFWYMSPLTTNNVWYLKWPNCKLNNYFEEQELMGKEVV